MYIERSLNIIRIIMMQKIFYVLSRCCLIISVALIAWGGYVYFKHIEDDIDYFMYAAIAALVGGLFEFLLDCIAEKNNPLSLKRIKVAKQHVIEVKHGLKQDFVDAFGLQMYEFLLQKGIIHQIRDERISEQKWEVTLYGETMEHEK